MLVIGVLVLGVGYPLVVTGVSTVIAASAARGSLVQNADGDTVGSALIGQNFVGPQWFQSRPSAAGQNGYDGGSSGGSNLGPNNEELLAAIEQRRADVQAQDKVRLAIPPDALTASGSGLDPHISPEYAQLQVARVAVMNGLSVNEVNRLVVANTESRQLGFLGEERVNVLMLNLAINSAKR